MQAIEDFTDERNKAWCIHCGNWIAELDANRDHVPSKSLLREPYLPNLPQVAVCKSCNEGLSLDEEYLSAFLACVLAGSTAPNRQRSRVTAMDETPIKAGRAAPGKMKGACFWPVYGEHDEVCFPFFESRRAEHVQQALGLKPAQGAVLLSDGYRLIRVIHPAARSRGSVDNTQPRELHLRNQESCPNKRGHLFMSSHMILILAFLVFLGTDVVFAQGLPGGAESLSPEALSTPSTDPKYTSVKKGVLPRLFDSNAVVTLLQERPSSSDFRKARTIVEFLVRYQPGDGFEKSKATLERLETNPQEFVKNRADDVKAGLSLFKGMAVGPWGKVLNVFAEGAEGVSYFSKYLPNSTERFSKLDSASQYYVLYQKLSLLRNDPKTLELFQGKLQQATGLSENTFTVQQILDHAKTDGERAILKRLLNMVGSLAGKVDHLATKEEVEGILKDFQSQMLEQIAEARKERMELGDQPGVNLLLEKQKTVEEDQNDIHRARAVNNLITSVASLVIKDSEDLRRFVAIGSFYTDVYSAFKTDKRDRLVLTVDVIQLFYNLMMALAPKDPDPVLVGINEILNHLRSIQSQLVEIDRHIIVMNENMLSQFEIVRDSLNAQRLGLEKILTNLNSKDQVARYVFKADQLRELFKQVDAADSLYMECLNPALPHAKCDQHFIELFSSANLFSSNEEREPWVRGSRFNNDYFSVNMAMAPQDLFMVDLTWMSEFTASHKDIGPWTLQQMSFGFHNETLRNLLKVRLYPSVANVLSVKAVNPVYLSKSLRQYLTYSWRQVEAGEVPAFAPLVTAESIDRVNEAEQFYTAAIGDPQAFSNIMHRLTAQAQEVMVAAEALQSKVRKGSVPEYAAKLDRQPVPPCEGGEATLPPPVESNPDLLGLSRFVPKEYFLGQEMGLFTVKACYYSIFTLDTATNQGEKFTATFALVRFLIRFYYEGNNEQRSGEIAIVYSDSKRYWLKSAPHRKDRLAQIAWEDIYDVQAMRENYVGWGDKGNAESPRSLFFSEARDLRFSSWWPELREMLHYGADDRPVRLKPGRKSVGDQPKVEDPASLKMAYYKTLPKVREQTTEVFARGLSNGVELWNPNELAFQTASGKSIQDEWKKTTAYDSEIKAVNAKFKNYQETYSLFLNLFQLALLNGNPIQTCLVKIVKYSPDKLFSEIGRRLYTLDVQDADKFQNASRILAMPVDASLALVMAGEEKKGFSCSLPEFSNDLSSLRLGLTILKEAQIDRIQEQKAGAVKLQGF